MATDHMSRLLSPCSGLELLKKQAWDQPAMENQATEGLATYRVKFAQH